jgi:hypothetical protein
MDMFEAATGGQDEAKAYMAGLHVEQALTG